MKLLVLQRAEVRCSIETAEGLHKVASTPGMLQRAEVRGSIETARYPFRPSSSTIVAARGSALLY